jgi:hypothetical protein
MILLARKTGKSSFGGQDLPGSAIPEIDGPSPKDGAFDPRR